MLGGKLFKIEVYKSNSQRALGMSADTAYSAFLLHSKRVLLTINIAGNLEHLEKICQYASYFSMLAQSQSASSSAVLLYWAEGSKQISFSCDVRNDALSVQVLAQKTFLFFVDTFVLCSLGLQLSCS